MRSFCTTVYKLTTATNWLLMMLHCTTMMWLSFLCRRTISLQICQSVLLVSMQTSARAHATRHWVKYFKDGNADINDLSCSIWTRTADTESTQMKIIKHDWKIAAQLGNEHCVLQEMMLTLGWILKSVLPLGSPLVNRQRKIDTYVCLQRASWKAWAWQELYFVLNITTGDESWFHSCNQK